MQTIEEESSPPLSSARIGESERNLRRTDCRKTWRKCSSYSASVLYRMRDLGLNRQKRSTETLPFRMRTNCPGGTSRISRYGVRWASGSWAKYPAM